MADKQRVPDTVNAVQETDQNSSDLGLKPVIPLPSPPSRTTQRAAAPKNAAEYGETGVDLIDVNDINDGVESCLEDHGEVALAHLGGLCTVDAMPATQTLTQTRQLDVTRRRLGRIGDIATQNTDTGSVSPLTLV